MVREREGHALRELFSGGTLGKRREVELGEVRIVRRFFAGHRLAARSLIALSLSHADLPSK